MHKIRMASVALLAATLAASGCVAVPARGYYAYGYAPYGTNYVTPGGIALTYDDGPGAYAAVGVPGLYWWGGNYYRRHAGYWQWSRHHNGPWAYRPAARVPFAAHRWGHGRGAGVWH